MSRRRSISSDISVDERLAAIALKNPAAALSWPWILLHLDDWGRGVASPIRIKLSVFPAFPFTESDIQATIDSLVEMKLIHRYEVDGELYLAVRPRTWIRYQTYLKGTKRDKNQSLIPAPVEAPWGSEEEEEMRQLMTRNSQNVSRQSEMSADNSDCRAMSVPLPSLLPLPSPLLKDLKEGASPPPEDHQFVSLEEQVLIEALKPLEIPLKNLRELMEEFRDRDLRSEFRAARDFLQGPKGKKRRSIPLTLRNWLKRAEPVKAGSRGTSDWVEKNKEALDKWAT